MSGTQSKIIKNTKKHENLIHKQEKNQYIEIHIKNDKDDRIDTPKYSVINVFQMVKKEEKKVHIFKLDMETICNNPNCSSRDENYNV